MAEEAAENTCLLNPYCLFGKSDTKPGERMSTQDLRQLRWIVGGVLLAVLLVVAVPIFFMTYPFKTVIFTQPVEVLNPRKAFINPSGEKEMIPQIPVNGIVHMKVFYEKFIPNPGLVIRTLIRKRGNEIQVLDSSTEVTTWGVGKGIADDTFVLNPNGFLVGDDTYVVFSIFYTLFGVRPIMVQYTSEKFSIVEVPGIPAIQCPPPRDWQHGR